MDLTIDQAKLVTENHNLIYGILKEYGLLHKEDDISDWYGIAAEGLVSAATTYNYTFTDNDFSYINDDFLNIRTKTLDYINNSENYNYEKGIYYFCSAFQRNHICKG